MPSLNTAPYSRGEVMRSSARSIPVSFNQSVLPHQYRGFGCFFFSLVLFFAQTLQTSAPGNPRRWSVSETLKPDHQPGDSYDGFAPHCTLTYLEFCHVSTCLSAFIQISPSISLGGGGNSSTKNSSCRLSHGWCVLLEQLRLNCWSQTPGRLVYRAIQGGTGCKTYRVQYPFSIRHGIRQRVVMRHVDAQLCYQISFGFSRLLLTIVFEE